MESAFGGKIFLGDHGCENRAKGVCTSRGFGGGGRGGGLGGGGLDSFFFRHFFMSFFRQFFCLRGSVCQGIILVGEYRR